MIVVKTAPDMFPEAEREMETHGCTIMHSRDHAEVTFPEGTTQREVLPRMPGGERFELVLPDGYIMHQQYVRYRDEYLLLYSREGMLTESESMETGHL